MPIKHIRKDEDIERLRKEAEEFIKTVEKLDIETGGKIEIKKMKSRKQPHPLPNQFCLCIDSYTKELLSDLIINKMRDITETIKTTYSSSDIIDLGRNFRYLFASLGSIATTKECDEFSQKEIESIIDIGCNYKRSYTEKEENFNKTINEVMDKLEEEYSDTFRRNLKR